MSRIKSIVAREIYDSRGTPTVEADVLLEDNSFGRAAVPSGASTGIYEALELRDGGSRLIGKGVRQAVANVTNTIAPELIGKQADQRSIDEMMCALDGSKTKANLGANAILAVSMALSKAAAKSSGLALWEYFRKLSQTVPSEIWLPVPMMNILNGGRHASNSSDFQEFMIMPVGANSFSQALEMGVGVFMELKKILSDDGFSTSVGDEGGFAPSLGGNQAPLDKISQAVSNAGFSLGKDIFIALDVASSEFYEQDSYHLKSENRSLSESEMTQLYQQWLENYPILSIEDPLDQDAWDGYSNLTEKLGDKIQIVGDDLFVTNTERLQQGIDQKAANAILIKLNQIGTVSETVDAIDLARNHGYHAIVSHRSGETEDTTIADFVVGLSTGQIKTGSASRSDRMAKYNQLLRIEESLKDRAIYPGVSAIPQALKSL